MRECNFFISSLLGSPIDLMYSVGVLALLFNSVKRLVFHNIIFYGLSSNHLGGQRLSSQNRPNNACAKKAIANGIAMIVVTFAQNSLTIICHCDRYI